MTNYGRPVIGKYELATLLSTMVRKISEMKELKEYCKVEGDGIINPTEIAYKLYKEHPEKLTIYRDNIPIKVSELVQNPLYDKLFEQYFEEQKEGLKKLE